MKITILAVGKIREDWLKQGVAEYQKRISKYCEIEIVEIPDAPENDSVEKALEEEGGRMLARLKPLRDGAGRSDREKIVALDVAGRPLDSAGLSQKLTQWLDQGGAKVTFLIAGSNGYGSEVLERANERIRLSDMTFPHQLTRLIFLEQLFRAFKIAKGEKYHK